MGSLNKNEIETHPDSKFFIQASTALFQTVKNNNTFYFSIDKDFFKKLTPMEQKLSLIISKYFSVYKKPPQQWKRNIFSLANQIPITSQNGRNIKRTLKRVCDGLINKKFKYLTSYSINGNIITFLQEEDNNEKIKQDGTEKNTIINTKDYLFEQLKKEISHNENDFPFFIMVSHCVPEDIIYRILSIVRQEAKNKIKLFTYLINIEAYEYIQSYIAKTAEKTNLEKNTEKAAIKTTKPTTKKEFYDSLSTEIKQKLFIEIKKLIPKVCETHDADSSIIVNVIINKFITDDFEIKIQ
jgi:hypothetical protein